MVALKGPCFAGRNSSPEASDVSQSNCSELSIPHGDMASAIHCSPPLAVWMDLHLFLKLELSLGNVVVCVEGEYQIHGDKLPFDCTKPSVVPLQGLKK